MNELLLLPLLEISGHNSVSSSSAAGLVKVHWLKVIIRLYHHRLSFLMVAMLCKIEQTTSMPHALSTATLSLFRHLNLSFSWPKVISVRALVLDRAALYHICGPGLGLGNEVIKKYLQAYPLSPTRIPS